MNQSDFSSSERELLLMQCRDAEVEGRDRVATAEKAVEALESDPNGSPELFRAAALACYNAGVNTRCQVHFEKAVELGHEIIQRFTDFVMQAEGHHFVGISVPRDQRAEARKHWEDALHLLETAAESTYARHLKARITNSLAEHLSYGSELEKTMAKRLFETSIELKQRSDIDDTMGLAISHGGLGRLFLFAEPPDYVSARHHFEENLRISEELGSVIGQTKMHSLLGAVDVGERKLVDAKERYGKAQELAAGQVDHIFALAGLTETCALLGQLDQADEHGSALADLIVNRVKESDPDSAENNSRSAIPVSCYPRIVQYLATAKALQPSPWHNTLATLIETDKLPPTTMR